MKRFIDTHCRYTETYEPEHIYTFTGDCKVTGAPYSVSVKGEELFKMRQTGKHDDAQVVVRWRQGVSNDGDKPVGLAKAFRIKKYFLVDSAHELGYHFCSYGTTTNNI